MKKPRVLILDIETSQIIAGVFRTGKQVVTHDNLHGMFSVYCAAWKWLGESKIYDVCVPKNNLLNDKRVIKKLKSLVEEADIIVGHNLDAFDLKKINSKCLLYEMGPIELGNTVDTLKVARKHFAMPNNKLDYLAGILGVGGKLDNTRGLWQRLLMGDATALVPMVKYNRQDVKIQEKVYKKMLPYITNHPNMNAFVDSDSLVCTNCGSDHVIKRGFKYTRAGKYQRYQCNDCGAVMRDRRATKTYNGR